MYGLAQGIHYWTVGLRERHAGVICEKSLLLGGDDTCMPESREVTTQVGLIEVKNVFKVTDAEGPFMEQIQNAESVRVCQGLQHL